MPRICVTAPGVYYTYELPVQVGAEVLVGTAPYCQLSLPEVKGLSEVHARISCETQGYMLADLKSATGVYANGKAVEHPVPLLPGVEYGMGKLTVKLDIPATASRIRQTPPTAGGHAAPMPSAPVRSAMQPTVQMPQNQPKKVKEPKEEKQSEPQSASQANPQASEKPETKTPQKSLKQGSTKDQKKSRKLNRREMSVLMARFHRRRGARYLFIKAAVAMALLLGVLHWCDIDYDTAWSELQQLMNKLSGYISPSSVEDEVLPAETSPVQDHEAVEEGEDAGMDASAGAEDDEPQKASAPSPWNTDLPREEVVVEASPAASENKPVAEVLKEFNLLNAPINPKAEYFIFYQASETCGLCGLVSSKLVQDYKKMRRKNVEVLLVSMDKSEKKALKHMEDYNMKFPGVLKDGKVRKILPHVTKLSGVPYVAIMDAKGNLITSGHGSLAWDWENIIFPNNTKENLRRQLLHTKIKGKKIDLKAKFYVFHCGKAGMESDCAAELETLEKEYARMRENQVELVLFVPMHSEEYISLVKKYKRKFPIVYYDWQDGLKNLPGFRFNQSTIVDETGKVISSNTGVLVDWLGGVNSVIATEKLPEMQAPNL